MKKYNENIARHLKYNELKMIQKMPKIDIFNNQVEDIKQLNEPNNFKGGVISLEYIQPGSNINTYFDDPLATEGSGLKQKRGRRKKIHGGTIWDDIGNVAKNTLPYLPYALPLLAAGLPKKPKSKKYTPQIEELIEQEQIKLPMKKRGRPKKQHNNGGNIFDDAYNGIKKVGHQISPYVREVGKELFPIAKDLAVEGIKSYVKGKGLRKPTKRNLLIKDLMHKHKISLGEASKYIKQHNLA